MSTLLFTLFQDQQARKFNTLHYNCPVFFEIACIPIVWELQKKPLD